LANHVLIFTVLSAGLLMPYLLGAVVVMWKFQWHVCGFLFTSPLAKLPQGVFYH